MIHPQQSTRMPIQKYIPFQDQIAVELPDRTWPDQVMTTAPRWRSVGRCTPSQTSAWRET